MENKKEDKLTDLSMELSVEVLGLVKELQNNKERIISNQIGRSATSICANIAESKYAHSRADFIAKLEIALKEASETENWLTVLKDAELLTVENFENTHKKVVKIKILLIKSIKTLKSKV